MFRDIDAVFIVNKMQPVQKLSASLLGSVKVAEWPPFGKELLPRLTICSRRIRFICCLVISYFGFEDRIWF